MKYVLSLYFHVEHGFGITDVETYISNANVPDRRQNLKEELRETINKNVTSPREFEQLTADELETQEEVNEFLINEIWKPLYGR